MAILELRNLCLTYPGGDLPAVNDINLELQSGCIHALVGESGCGKSSTIRLIAGLELPDKGEIYYQGNCLNKPGYAAAPEKRGIGMVFQDNALFPHLTIAENIRFGIRNQGLKGIETVSRYLKLTGLTDLAGRYPHEISGGQMQRASLARALAPGSKLILLDEPFNNLDVRIKQPLLADVRQILKETGSTALFITHDRQEAYMMADQISVMKQGRLLQSGTADELYYRPNTSYVADFFGKANHIPVRRTESGLNSCFGKLPLLPSCDRLLPGAEGLLIHRPQDVELCEPGGIMAGGIRVVVLSSVFMGEYQEVRCCAAESDRDKILLLHIPVHYRVKEGQSIDISFNNEKLWLCPEETYSKNT